MLQTYKKPTVTRVEMRPVEASLAGCKTNFFCMEASGISADWLCTDNPDLGCKDFPGS